MLDLLSSFGLSGVRMWSFILCRGLLGIPSRDTAVGKWGQQDWAEGEADLQCCCSWTLLSPAGSSAPRTAFQNYLQLSIRAGPWCPVSITYRPQAISSRECNGERGSSLKPRAISVKGGAMIPWEPVFPAVGVSVSALMSQHRLPTYIQASTSNLISLSINIRNYHLLGNSFSSPLQRLHEHR